ncbi:hypothetical protein N665_0008s0017 [Sinapis alba]|nr:hypothetical protein N665_0008s0017 [Sinapis alba]
MENRSDVQHSRRIPERMFALGDEPVGVRVTPYHKPFAITNILRSLEEDEVDVVRRSPFGKLLEIAEKPTFSGRFGRYMISRQLKVKKKHEAWFLFAGKPVRFSLREFAIVTGLNCANYPAHSKKKTKNHINEKPYWAELFGTLKEVPVNSVIRMLKKRSVTDKETRIKYAYLALLASVVLPTTHTPKISHEHAERIKDLEGFLAFPWGRLSFELLMSSIKERNEVSLSQNTIALKGFVMALQLVMIEAVPALTEDVHDGDSSGSEGDYADEDELTDEDRRGKRSISPGHARETDHAGKVDVVSIVSVGNEECNGQGEFGWSDDEADVCVDNLVKLIEEGFPFTHTCFTGGASKLEVERMREETRAEAELRKTTKQKTNHTSVSGLDAEYIASSVKARLSEDLQRVSGDLNRIGTQLKNFGDAFGSLQTTIVANVEEMLEKFRVEIVKNISNPIIVSPGPLREPVTQTGGTTCCDNATMGDFSNPHVRPPVNGGNIGDVTDDTIRGKEVSFCQHILLCFNMCITFCWFHTSLLTNKCTHVQVGKNGEEILMSNNPSVHDDVSQRNRGGNPAGIDASHIIEEAMQFADKVLDPHLVFPDPTFSLGLTQGDPQKGNTSSELDNQSLCDMDMNKGDTVGVPGPESPCNPFRKSKRQKVVPKALVGDYQCDKTFLTRAWEAHVAGHRNGDNIDVAAKYAKLIEMLKTPFSIMVGAVKIESKDLCVLVEKSTHLPTKVVDVLMYYSRSIYKIPGDHNSPCQAVFLDTKFVSQLSKSYGRFSKAVKKEVFKFSPTMCSTFNEVCPNLETSTFYFPFNFDKTHWVGVCIDTTTSQLIVLDCNNSIRTDVMMFKEMGPISVMFPYFLKQAGKQVSVKPLAIERPRTVPQIPNIFYSAVTSVVLMQAHAFGGVEVCRCITSSVVDAEVERLAVNVVEANHCPI